jgi:pimeloyl-ACP methyl ester carboxylesterase
MHGWNGGTEVISPLTSDRLAKYGFFVLVVGMRGRNSADGARDASGREIYDIYDAVAKCRTDYAGIVSATKAAIVGYSGGGGNALAAAAKIPDFWSCVVSHFGPSDYGRDGTDGWYANNGGAYTAGIVTAVGDTPANLPNNYYARDATAAITNYMGGSLYLFHDQADATVPFVHSTRIKTAMDAAALTNYSYSVTTVGDDPRWIHGYPEDNPDLIEAEAIWKSAALNNAAWTVPAAGTLTCIGYLKTKRFEMRLGTLADHAATVVYGVVADQYTVTPLTGEVVVTITQADSKTVTQTISSETTLTVV